MLLKLFKIICFFDRASKTPKIDIENFFDDISQDFLLDSALPTDSPAKKDEPGAR